MGWTLTAAVDRDGLWDNESVTFDEPPDEHDEDDEEDFVDNDGGGMTGAAVLLPYDDDLVYASGHILLTPGVFGTAGGRRSVCIPTRIAARVAG